MNVLAGDGPISQILPPIIRKHVYSLSNQQRYFKNHKGYGQFEPISYKGTTQALDICTPSFFSVNKV